MDVSLVMLWCVLIQRAGAVLLSFAPPCASRPRLLASNEPPCARSNLLCWAGELPRNPAHVVFVIAWLWNQYREINEH